jgi:hypothetical protein
MGAMSFVRRKIFSFWDLMKDTGGQMAIFIALIFQILFVFFAMIINIGLTIHDKINLQNSVDLAAYYAASKQAEVLNLLAHINYQIRQDYKLLAYRQRVIGGFGYEGHPAYSTNVGPFAEIPIPGEGGLLADQPAICITHRQWKDYMTQGNESLCRSTLNRVAELPRTPVIAGFNPINAAISSLIDSLRQGIGESCNVGAGANWYYAALINYAYKVDIARRKQAFINVARTLSESQTDFKDIDGNEVIVGAEKTLRKNLTRANLVSLATKSRSKEGGGKLLMYNSLGTGATGDDLPRWLAEIPIEPILLFVNHQGGSGSCTNAISALGQVTPSAANQLDPQGALSAYIGEPEITNPYHSSRGFEKNPWFMAYVGVYAESTPRKPFAPFGSVVKLKAQAFAKPFGGRIGPWELSGWSPSAKQSDIGVPVDPLAVPRVGRVNRGENILVDQGFIPNYSRYPGDRLGLKSSLAASLGKFYLNVENPAGRPATANYVGITQLSQQNGDSIAFDQAFSGGALYNAETAAISPDLFDIAYYSIDPEFNKYYLNKGLARTLRVPADLGTNATKQGSIDIDYFNANGAKTSFPNASYFYMLTDVSHILTGWTQSGEANYQFPVDKFGNCQSNPKDVPLPGNCIIGGRTGYSVKLVSIDYLKSSNHQLGGETGGKGPIINGVPSFFLSNQTQ